MPYHNISQFLSSTLPTTTIMNRLRDNLRYFKGVDGAQTIEDALTVQGPFSADSMRFPRLSTSQRNALTQQDGLAIYNTGTDQFQVRVGGSWENMTAAAPVNEGYTPTNVANQGTLPSGLDNATGIAWDEMQLVITQEEPLSKIWTLSRNADGGYTPANASEETAGFYIRNIQDREPGGVTWDGQQLVSVFRGGWIGTMPRDANGRYTANDVTSHGTLSVGGRPGGITWDDTQLVIVGGNHLYRLARNADGTYTPANDSAEGDFPSGLSLAQGLAWDQLQLVVVDDTGDEMYTLRRDGDGGYTPANAALEGVFPSTLGTPRGVTWDGMQTVILDPATRRLYTLPPDYA